MAPAALAAYLEALAAEAKQGGVTAERAAAVRAELAPLAAAVPAEHCPHAAELLRLLPDLLAEAVRDAAYAALVVECASELVGACRTAAAGGDGDAQLAVTAEKLRLFAPEPASAPAAAAAAAAAPAVYDYDQYGDAINDFVAEAGELINALEQDLLALPGATTDTLHRIFRCIHTFKGMSGMVGLTGAHRLTHQMETLLAKIRDREIAATPAMETTLLQGVDFIRAVVNCLEQRSNPLLDAEAQIAAVAVLLAGGTPPPAAPAPAAATAAAAPPPSKDGAAERGGGAPPPANAFLRVEIAKLDAVMAQVGELLVERMRLLRCQQQAAQLVGTLRQQHTPRRRREPPEAAAAAAHLAGLEQFAGRLNVTVEAMLRVTGGLQESVMRMRLVPLAQTFARFPRLVRDLGAKLGKEIRLELRGAETEIDKSVCELLPEPLIHLVRNSIDHGIERPERRQAAGKPAAGTITLSAFYEGDKVTIEITDDGGGIDEDRVVMSALEKELITEEEAAAMPRAQKLKLIFMPGFSTAAAVTDVSGRGVGMDVVKTTIEKLNGVIEVLSEPGRGTTVRLKLPITMAILKILRFRLAGRELALPLANVRETLLLPAAELYASNQRLVINLRGSLIPLVFLADVFGAAASRSLAGPEQQAVIIVEAVDRVFGLVVDGFIGNSDIIIKHIDGVPHTLPFIAGGAIMGDGEVVPVLDLLQVAEAARQHAAGGLPAAAPEPAAADAAGERPAAKAILIVEDSPTQARLLAEMLQESGCRIDLAASGEAALDLVRRHTYDLISTDIVMPGIDGYEFVRRLRELPAYRLTPVVALTQRGAKLDRIRGFQAGIDEYLAKPINEEIYLGTVNGLLARGRMGD